MLPKFDDVDGTDLDVLNYVLALERVEDAFYVQAMEMVSEDDFLESEAMAAYSEERRGAVYADLQSFAEHEATHVEALAGVVELVGGTVPEAGTYDFGVVEPADVVATGQVLETAGVAAYAGASPCVESPDLLGVALSIHSVEARHAALLNQLAGESVAPDAFDEAAAQEDVLEAVSQFAVDDGGMGGNESEGNETDTPGTPTPGGNGSEGNESDTTWLRPAPGGDPNRDVQLARRPTVDHEQDA